MSSHEQNYANHRRLVPLFHYVAFPILFVNFLRAGYLAFRSPSFDSLLSMLVGFALLVSLFAARIFALKAQDRVIRLEMRLRMRQVLPPDLHPRIAEFTHAQLVALRFASDAELPALAAAVLKDGIKDQNTIKKMVTNWQADHLRV